MRVRDVSEGTPQGSVPSAPTGPAQGGASTGAAAQGGAQGAAAGAGAGAGAAGGASGAAAGAGAVDAGWNVGGYANTSVQRVPVTAGASDRKMD